MTIKTPIESDGTAYDERPRDPHCHEDIQTEDWPFVVTTFALAALLPFLVGFALGRVFA